MKRSITSRPYRGADDLGRIQDFISHQNAGLHRGDFAHRLYNINRRYQPSEIVRLWEDDHLRGWMMLYPRWADFDFQTQFPELAAEMLGWAEQQLEADEIGTDVFGQDVSRRHRLEQHGFRQVGEQPVYHLTVRSLHDPLPDVSLPEGFTIRSAAGLHEAEALAAVHAGAFGSEWTPGMYAALMQTPGYHMENELVAAAPDGRLAGFCILWHDPILKTGLFEPVGVHADFHRRGLGRALMVEGMRRMQAAGMETALVGHEVENPASTALYHGLGFEDKGELFRYRKTKK